MPTDLVEDSAVLRCDLVTPGTLVAVGGTRGGLKFNPGIEIRAVPFDGKKSSRVVGLDRIVNRQPTITGTLLLINEQTLRMFEPGGSGSTLTVTPKAAGAMFAVGDYKKFDVTWDRSGGGTVVVTFPYGLVTQYEIGSQDQNEGEVPITIEACQRLDDGSSTTGEVPYTIVITDPS
jgi:hypothetical protein